MATIEGHFTLSPEQREFKTLLSNHPRLENYWDFQNRSCDVERLRNDLNVLSSGEVIMARFLAGVWLGENTLDFDLIEAARVLDSEQLEIITGWLSNPLFP